MDDVTDTVFRQIIAGCAPADLYFTEFVNVDGLMSAGREKLLIKLKFSENERPIIAQIWGKTPKNYHQVAKQIANGTLALEANNQNFQGQTVQTFDGLDLNMGCPDKSICQNGCCAALINDRQLAQQIIDAAKQGLSGSLPLSVKTRIGYNQIDLSWIEFLLSQKLDMLTIHARTKKEMSKVPAHWEIFANIVKMRDEIAPKTLIVGNGDVVNRKNGATLAKKYNLDGIMIGRGIFGDPYAFSETSPWDNLSKAKKIELFKAHIKIFDDTWQNNERKTITLNKFCKIYINGFDGAKEMRESLMKSKSTNELIAKLAEK